MRVQPLFPSRELCCNGAVSLLPAQHKDWLACPTGFGDQQPPTIRCPVTPKPFKAASEVLLHRPSPAPINRDVKYYPISNIGHGLLRRSVHGHCDAKWYLQERHGFLDSNPWGKPQRLWPPRPHGQNIQSSPAAWKGNPRQNKKHETRQAL